HVRLDDARGGGPPFIGPAVERVQPHLRREGREGEYGDERDTSRAFPRQWVLPRASIERVRRGERDRREPQSDREDVAEARRREPQRVRERQPQNPQVGQPADDGLGRRRGYVVERRRRLT